jgi:spermidine synthase
MKAEKNRVRVLHVLFGASGAAALIYQVLWVRAFADLFGATAEAAAAILAAFFLGLAFGSDYFGRVADRTERPLRLYAGLELGIGVAALPVLAVLVFYRSVYDELYRALIGVPGLFTLSKMALTAIALFPATAMMGGTLPAMGRALVGDRGSLGRAGGRLYAVNIVGAVVGAVLAAFGLPLWLGTRGSYGLAVALSLLVATAAALLARSEPLQPPVTEPEAAVEESGAAGAGSRRLLAVAFGSGLATLGLQLLWTRMLALVLQNSVYSFGAVVAVFLGGLALGAALVAWLLRWLSAWRILRLSLLATALLVLLTPSLLTWLTGGLEHYTGYGGWLAHSLSTIGLTAAVILLPVILAGMALPCVWELWRGRPGSGSRLGRPTAVNTLGAILGPLLAGFVALPKLGLGASIGLIGGLYLLMGETAAPRAQRPKRGGWERAIVYPAMVFILAFYSPTKLPVASVGEGERLIWARESARGAVAVVDRAGDVRIKLDNHYAIGGSGVVVEERRQGHVPLLLHPEPRRVAFIGMGTGITAGAALAHAGPQRIVVMELVPEVIEAAREHLRPWNEALVDDPRVQVVAEDGRNHLAGTNESFDVIVADLFVPWRQGVGSLYTREHFETVKERLRPGGIFAQWLPLWQLSRREFEIIAATFLEVFDRVTLWRGVFNPAGSSLALVAHHDARPIDLAALESRLADLRARNAFEDGFLAELTGFMILYAGDLSGEAVRLGAAGINSAVHPRIEWLAPRTLREVELGRNHWFSGAELADLYDAINQAASLPGDRLLTGGLPPRIYRRAGASFYRAEVLAASGDPGQAEEYRRRAFQLLDVER